MAESLTEVQKNYIMALHKYLRWENLSAYEIPIYIKELILFESFKLQSGILFI